MERWLAAAEANGVRGGGRRYCCRLFRRSHTVLVFVAMAAALGDGRWCWTWCCGGLALLLVPLEGGACVPRPCAPGSHRENVGV
jgi:hypothetical protein